MFLPVILIALGEAVVLLITKNNRFILSLFATLMAVFVASLISICTREYTTVPKYDMVSSSRLAAMHSSDSQAGSFLFATGYFGEEQLYHYYIVTPDEGYIYKSVRAEGENVIVFEDETNQDKIRLEVSKCRMVSINNFSKYLLNFLPELCPDRYEFHIPKGSLIQEFKLK